MAEATIAAGFAKAFLDFAVSRGADRRILIERSRIRPDDLTEEDNRVLLADYIALMKAGIELCNEPALALLFGEEVRLPDISIVGVLGRAETAEDARRQANRYSRLAVDEGDGDTSDRLEFVRKEEKVWFKFKSTVYVDNPLLTESAFARCVCDGRALSEATGGVTRWPYPKAIRFTHEEPSYRAEYDRIFGTPLVFRSHMNAILFDEELLSVRLPHTNPYVFRLLSQHAEALLTRLDNSKSARGRVESLLMPMLHTGQASMEMIAGKLGISRQTLFRKLKAEGVTFEKVLDKLRHKLALHYLKGKKVSVNETAYLVGFSEPAAFSRAFKRWTGSSPRMMKASKVVNGRTGDADSRH